MLNRVGKLLFLYIVTYIYIEAIHFQGGTITYKVLNGSGTTVSILLTETYMFTYVSTRCTDDMIAQQSPVTTTNIQLQCFKKENQTELSKGITSKPPCIDYSTSLDMTVVQSSTVLSLEDVLHCLVTYTDGNWRQLSLPAGVVYGSWSLLCLINLQLRANGKYNTPPMTTMISPMYIPAGIPQTILIPTIDADNDQVRCRFATTEKECASVCYPNSLPLGTMMFPNCTLLITGSNDSDWYAVTIMIEDFLDSTATSSLSVIPVQFLIKVQTESACPQRPILIGPDVQSDRCIGVEVGTPVHIELLAENFCPNSTTIKDIAILSFPFLTKAPIVRNSTTVWSVSLTWTPAASQVGSQILCAVAIDSVNVQSNQYCMSFIVAEKGVPSCPGQLLPITTDLTPTAPDILEYVRCLLDEETTSSSCKQTDRIGFRTSSSSFPTELPVSIRPALRTSDCHFPWPWPWLAPLLSFLGTFLFTSVLYCCCCPHSRQRHETRSVATNTCPQGDFIDVPARPYTVYDAFERKEYPKRYRRPSHSLNNAKDHSATSSRRTSTATSNSVHPTSLAMEHQSLSARSNAYMFGQQTAPERR